MVQDLLRPLLGVRLEQRFHLNAIAATSLSSVRRGELLAYSVLIFFPGQTPAETAAASARCTLRSTSGSLRVCLILADGTDVFLDLEQRRIAVGNNR